LPTAPKRGRTFQIPGHSGCHLPPACGCSRDDSADLHERLHEVVGPLGSHRFVAHRQPGELAPGDGGWEIDERCGLVAGSGLEQVVALTREPAEREGMTTDTPRGIPGYGGWLGG